MGEQRFQAELVATIDGILQFLLRVRIVLHIQERFTAIQRTFDAQILSADGIGVFDNFCSDDAAEG